MAQKQPDLKYAFNLPPEKAIEYFRSKGHAFSWNWQDVWQEAHAKAFTVAKAMRMDVLQDIRGMVQKALDEGITFQQFKKELEPRLRAKGWWGKKLVGDERGGKAVQLGSPYRLKTIFSANTQTAYMAGRYKQMMGNVEDRPYWQYVAVLDSRTRPGHRILAAKVFRYDDPFWDSHYPPNGWRCRCRVRALDEGNLKSRNLAVESSEGELSTEQVRINREGATKPVTVYTDRKTGLTMAPDAGWSYNPGKETWKPDLGKYDPDIRKLYKEEARTEAPLFAHIKSKAVRSLCQEAFEDAPDDLREVVKRCQASCAVRAANVKVSQYNPLTEAISLSRNTVSSSAVDTMRHEFGHHVDFQALSDAMPKRLGQTSFAGDFKKAFDREATGILNDPVKESRLREKVGKASGTWYYDPHVSDLIGSLTRNLVVGYGSHTLRYLMHPGRPEAEVFADLFAVYGRKERAGWEFVRRELPSLAKAFEDVIGRLKENIL